MDFKIQLFFKIILILLVCSFTSYSQSCDSIALTNINDCKRVIMPESLFIRFFVAKKNLDSISQKINNVDIYLDSLEDKNKLLEEKNKELVNLYNKEIKNYRENNNDLKSGLKECITVLNNIEKENIDLRIQNSKLKKNNPKLFIGGTVLGSLLTALIVNTIKNL